MKRSSQLPPMPWVSQPDSRGIGFIDFLKVWLCLRANLAYEFVIVSLSVSGNVSVGNLNKFLPFVLQEIEKQPRRQYLLLHSLKEVRHL